jgi:hypothetical protein
MPNPPDERPTLYGPDGKPLKLPEGSPYKKETPQATTSQPSQIRSNQLLLPRTSLWRRHIKLVVTTCVATIGLIGALFSFYVARPRPTAVAVISSGTPDPYAMRFALSNAGGLSMHKVDVSCDYTKLIFERANTLIIGDRFIASMYRVPDIGPGEGFVVKCPEPWRYFTARDMSTAIITLGDLLPEYNARSFYFTIQDDGQITALNIPANVKQRCGECIMHPVSDLDLTIIVKYKTIIPWVSCTDSVRFIGTQGTDGTIAWQTAPLSQAPIKEPSKGPIFALNGGQMLATNEVPARSVTSHP